MTTPLTAQHPSSVGKRKKDDGPGAPEGPPMSDDTGTPWLVHECDTRRWLHAQRRMRRKLDARRDEQLATPGHARLTTVSLNLGTKAMTLAELHKSQLVEPAQATQPRPTHVWRSIFTFRGHKIPRSKRAFFCVAGLQNQGQCVCPRGANHKRTSTL